MFYGVGDYKMGFLAGIIDQVECVVFWVVRPCNCENLRRFGGHKKTQRATFFLHGLLLDLENGGNIFLRNL
jgi:hypothetical protein